jgi:nicotinate-nucleotide--dimethylbenzimidazole phosphoribosyltransferase
MTITPLSKKLQHTIQETINGKTKPVGALGKLEDIALQIGLIQETITPLLRKPHILVFAADHGIAATGLVNPYPQAVTAQMVQNFATGGAAINVFCRQHGIELRIVDSGVNASLDHLQSHPHFIDAKIAKGTANYAATAAMTAMEFNNAWQQSEAIIDAVSGSGCNCIGFGEMGIGNTSAAALMMSAITGIPVTACVGRGTGVNEAQLQTKISTLEKVFALHKDTFTNTQSILQTVGGFELVMMTAAFLRAAALKMVIVVDGFICSAALLAAQQMDPAVIDYCIFAHVSGEQAHGRMLEYMGAKPLLDMGLRLGEGTGAALVMPLLQSSVAFLTEMASFDTAGVSTQVQ